MNSNFWFYSSGHCQKPCLPILPICDLGAARRYLMLEKSLLKIIDFATLCFLQLSQNQLFYGGTFTRYSSSSDHSHLCYYKLPCVRLFLKEIKKRLIQAFFKVAGTGFEPATPRVWTACSSQLSYPAIWYVFVPALQSRVHRTKCSSHFAFNVFDFKKLSREMGPIGLEPMTLCL